MVDAILFVWYPGMEGGRAVADVLFGDVSPAGKLPITFPKSLDQLPAFDDYSMKGRTYRYMTEEPLYPFGFGLSYSRFEYSELQLDKAAIAPGDSLNVSLTVPTAAIGLSRSCPVLPERSPRLERLSRFIIWSASSGLYSRQAKAAP